MMISAFVTGRIIGIKKEENTPILTPRKAKIMCFAPFIDLRCVAKQAIQKGQNCGMAVGLRIQQSAKTPKFLALLSVESQKSIIIIQRCFI